MRATFHRCVTANCGLFPWQLEHFHEHAAHSGKSMLYYPRTSFEPHPKSFMLNAFSLQKASHCWQCLKSQSEKQSKSSQFVLHRAICKTTSVLSLKTIISLWLKACASVCDSFRNCKTVKRAKMPKWNIYILYQNIHAYFDGLYVIILPRIDSLLWARAENYFRWFIFLLYGVIRDILKFCT